MKFWKKFILGMVAGLTLTAAAPAFSACFIFVHGHQDHNLTPQEARDYWKKDNWWPAEDRDMVATISAGSNNSFKIVNWNSLVPYYQAAIEVAGKINTHLDDSSCGNDYPVVVSHSNGGVVMDFILGNANSSEPNYNYGGAQFDQVANRIYRHYSVQAPHRGTEAADATCGNSSWFCDGVAGFIAECDQGTEWLQSADSYQVSLYSGSPAVTTFLFGGYEAMASSSCLSGEDDGVVSYAGAFACSGSSTAAYETDNVCQTHQESAGFVNGVQTHENHDDGRNDNDRDTVRAIAGGLDPDGSWDYGRYSGSTGTQIRSGDSTAELIHEVWAD